LVAAAVEQYLSAQQDNRHDRTPTAGLTICQAGNPPLVSISLNRSEGFCH
jgi:hypothetical protein